MVPIALNGCKAWIMSCKHENKLLVFEMAALRGMLAVSHRDKIRNVDIQERLGVKETSAGLLETAHLVGQCVAIEQ